LEEISPERLESTREVVRIDDRIDPALPDRSDRLDRVVI
jgi:hypothetical protein